MTQSDIHLAQPHLPLRAGAGSVWQKEIDPIVAKEVDILSHVMQWGSVVDYKWLVEILEYETDYLLVAFETV